MPCVSLRTTIRRPLLLLLQPYCSLTASPKRCQSHTASSLPADPTTTIHTTLDTFLTHARLTGLSPTTTVYIGTHYEYICLSSLSRFGLSLSRTGGRLDKGIDLLGVWKLPGGRVARAIVQCKAVKRKAAPALVRELEGAFNGVPPTVPRRPRARDEVEEDIGQEEGEGVNIIALLCTPLPATKGVRDALGRSRWPMGYVMVGLEGRVTQVLWNRAAAERGGLGLLEVGVRYLPEEEVIEDAMDGEGETEKKALKNEIVLQDGKGGLWDWPLDGSNLRSGVEPTQESGGKGTAFTTAG